ncbi:hypothetical protein UC8_38360 [Roseimaritima ulvae]|uniref:Uncharacterized protein n=1 Tax=Roseimaritima ulvae TaxID=980254 RepID=A0A5B9QV09_9BACT|nr:hypothetical protein UC8_38360 [Roseimaritima ulvae]
MFHPLLPQVGAVRRRTTPTNERSRSRQTLEGRLTKS